MTLSRWTDNSGNSIDDILSNIMNYSQWIQLDKDPLEKKNLKFFIEKAFKENQKIILNDTEITYNYINYEYEKVQYGEEDNPLRSVRINSVSGYVIIYTDGSTTQYIINRSINGFSKTVLRRLNNYTKNRIITDSPILINQDFIIWLIYKVSTGLERSMLDECHLLVKMITGWKGSTQDKLAHVSGKGDRILNNLGTLAFLFENENVSNIQTQIEYINETLDVSLNLNGTIDVDLSTYTGDYLLNEYYEKNSKVILTVFLVIIPKLLSAYKIDLDTKEWSSNKKIDFFNEIGTSITNKIKEKIDTIAPE
ncbi:hypothetical protein ACTOS9_03390 [Bacillus subtilis]|uniref:Uncharacterized protein n=1 Tax=Bacillus subtilis TaxID=1423 RepID=A0AAX3RN49_BACIU|nr:hypothetical protein P5633_21725 [Bacillus subtilis]WGD63122.1 hypothetical protein P5648_03435 [Bacillus subtilis]WGD71093.1 hypothetical protein P5645_18975 [Bacillus subtilis]WGD76309.1 hypothetical protein P5631_03770 [Bacillus subtilis]